MMKENPQYDPAREKEGPPKKVNKKKDQVKRTRRRKATPESRRRRRSRNSEGTGAGALVLHGTGGEGRVMYLTVGQSLEHSIEDLRCCTGLKS